MINYNKILQKIKKKNLKKLLIIFLNFFDKNKIKKIIIQAIRK